MSEYAAVIWQYGLAPTAAYGPYDIGTAYTKGRQAVDKLNRDQTGFGLGHNFTVLELTEAS